LTWPQEEENQRDSKRGRFVKEEKKVQRKGKMSQKYNLLSWDKPCGYASERGRGVAARVVKKKKNKNPGRKSTARKINNFAIQSRKLADLRPPGRGCRKRSGRDWRRTQSKGKFAREVARREVPLYGKR